MTSKIVEVCEGCQACDACLRMQEMHGTCVYVAQTVRCTCDQKRSMAQLGKRKRNTQSTLITESTDRVRLAYWRQWMRTTGIEEGWMVVPEPPAPNLLKTDGGTSDDD